MNAVRRRRRLRHGDDGASALELALYTPILLLVILLTVQFALMYLGNQAAQAAAREAARVARVGGGTGEAMDAAVTRGNQIAATVGEGVLLDVNVNVQPINGQVRVTVTGTAMKLVPGIPAPPIEQIVQGPLEEFVPDL